MGDVVGPDHIDRSTVGTKFVVGVGLVVSGFCAGTFNFEINNKAMNNATPIRHTALATKAHSDSTRGDTDLFERPFKRVFNLSLWGGCHCRIQ